ncbi:MAG: flavin reductase family protein, partial [Anaerolineae bacterium]|nr:flavin reductase family protein [Anaerolineae bacterium]
TGSPIVPGTLGWLDCTVRHSYEGGDHTIFVGEVVAGATGDQTEPLLYYNRAWRELACPAEAVPA